MKNEMLAILRDMTENGYELFNDTPEQFIDRMISYGFGVDFMIKSRDRFFKFIGKA